jgi:TRAP-type mannitol/chloroaromatic compound transport system permease large subunit
VLALLYIIYTLVRSYYDPSLGPALPIEDRAESVGEVVRELLLGIAPVVVIIFATLASSSPASRRRRMPAPSARSPCC